jgi:alkylation response protein AidB-like acyl-CoA dehydrogenase
LQKFIASEINPHVDEWEKADIFPAHELFKKLGDLGFLGLNKPEAYGGQGLDYSYALMMAEELGAITCGGVPMAIGVQTDMATPALARFGSDEVRREFLAPGDFGRSGRLHRRVRTPAPALTSPRSRPTRAPMATTTSSTAARCGSPTACRPTGSVCSSTPATAKSIATSR